MRHKNMKKFLCWLVVFGLVFSLGITTYALDGAAAGRAAAATIDIASVEVINGGAIQAQYRDQVYVEDGKYYTTERGASFTDSRRFNFEIVIPAAGLPDLTDPDLAAEFLDGLDWTYGDIPLTEWLSGTGFSGSNSFIQLESQEISEILNGADAGDYLLEASILFLTPYAVSSTPNASTNIPYAGYSSINQSGFNRAVMLNGRTGNYPNAGKGIGTYTLQVEGTDGVFGTCDIKLNLYDSFHRWEEIDSYSKDLKALAGAGKSINGRYVDVNSLGKTLDGRDIWNVVVAKNAAIVDDYQNRIKPLMNSNPDALMAEAMAGTLTQVVYLNNVHPDEVPGSDAIIRTIEDLIWKTEISYGTYDDYDRRFTNFPGVTNSRSYHIPLGGKREQVMDLTEVLDNFIVVSTITCNPDGKFNMIRGNRYGFDLNRDASFQTQPEGIALNRDTTYWDPLIMLEYHGYVTNMLIEPCTLPHDPNYEYDLMQSNMLQLAYYAGMAINGETTLEVFHVPWDHRTGGWDDGGTVYGPMFAMLFGTLGYTIEIPYATEDCVDACYTCTNSMIYNLLHGDTAIYNDHPVYKDRITLDQPSHPRLHQSTLINKLECKKRGIDNIDAVDKVDKYLVEYANNAFRDVGRIRKDDPANPGQKLSFFPDYLIVPGTPETQWNVAEAMKSLEIAQNFGVELLIATDTIEDNNGNKYPAGTYVIPMAQAARNYINEVFAKGFDASSFASMYAEIVTNYPDTRGFDCVEVWNKDYSGSTEPVVGFVSKPNALISGAPGAYIAFKSNSVDSVRFVNKLLSGTSSGKFNLPSSPTDVWMLSKNFDKGGMVIPMSSYVIKAEDLGILNTLKDDADFGLKGCYIEGWYLNSLPAVAKKLVDPVIHLTATRTSNSGNPVHWALDDYLGFSSMKGYDGTGTASLRPGANVILLNNSAGSEALSNAARAGKLTVIGTGGGNTTSFATNQLGVTGFATGTGTGASSTDATFNVHFNKNSLFAAAYEGTGSVHLTGSTMYYTSLPESAKGLFATDAVNPFIGGFYQNWNNMASTMNMYDRTVAYSLFSTETAGQNIQVVALPNIFSRPHYHKLYPMLAVAIFAGAAGILDDMNAPVIDGISLSGANAVVSAFDTESGVGTYSFYLWDTATKKYVLKSKQTNSGFAVAAGNRYNVVVADYADNETSQKFAFANGAVFAYDNESAEPSAVVEKLNGNKNNLTVTVKETFYKDGVVVFTKTLSKKFSIDNNAAATYDVEGYKVYVDTKGNVQIRECRITNFVAQ